MPTTMPVRERPSAPAPLGWRVTGPMVLAMILTFFGIIFVANYFLISYAISSFSGEDAPSAYQAGLNFEKDVVASKAQIERKWDVKMEITSGHSLSVQVNDASGSPIPALTGTVQFQHPADRKLDVTVPVSDAGGGHYSASIPDEVGQRLAVLTLSDTTGVVFRSSNRMNLK